MEEPKRMYRSKQDRQIAGVCGGLAEYFNIDSTIVRLVFVLFALMGGPGLLIYIILAVVIPEAPDEKRKNTVIVSADEPDEQEA
jgi:phage shock protein C